MAFFPAKFLRGFTLAILVCAAGFFAMRYFGVQIALPFGFGKAETTADLAARAEAALDAVKKRQPGDRRPASYDGVLAPLDQLLRQARDLTQSETFNPENDLAALRALVDPVIDIATRADAQAKTETGPLAKSFRFNDQKGEAAQYLATALWERINAMRPRAASAASLEEKPRFSETDMAELRRVLTDGLKANPDNRDLWYVSALANRLEGNFVTAARDLERTAAITPDFAAAWNVLGLVRIALKDFDKAEEALEKAKNLAVAEARQANAPLGAEYAAIIYNLGTFHEGLATYYNRENRISPGVEARRLATKHSADARKYLEEFLKMEPEGSPDAQDARARLRTL